MVYWRRHPRGDNRSVAGQGPPQHILSKSSDSFHITLPFDQLAIEFQDSHLKSIFVGYFVEACSLARGSSYCQLLDSRVPSQYSFMF
jgi:hypothetical protein